MRGVNTCSMNEPNEKNVNMLKSRCPKSPCTKPQVSSRSYWCERLIAGGQSSSRSSRRTFLNATNETTQVTARMIRVTGAATGIAAPRGGSETRTIRCRAARRQASRCDEPGPLRTLAHVVRRVRTLRHDAPAARARVFERRLHQRGRDAAPGHRVGHDDVRDDHRRAVERVVERAVLALDARLEAMASRIMSDVPGHARPARILSTHAAY